MIYLWVMMDGSFTALIAYFAALLFIGMALAGLLAWRQEQP